MNKSINFKNYRGYFQKVEHLAPSKDEKVEQTLEEHGGGLPKEALGV